MPLFVARLSFIVHVRVGCMCVLRSCSRLDWLRLYVCFVCLCMRSPLYVARLRFMLHVCRLHVCFSFVFVLCVCVDLLASQRIVYAFAFV